jgi:uncharacterized C2H2 Zn-finger protein
MVSYTCERCHKTFNNKTKYDNHINRKYPCKQHIQDDLVQLREELKEKDAEIIRLRELVDELHQLVDEKNQQIISVLNTRDKEKINIKNSNVNVNVINMTTFGRENKNDLNKRELVSILNSGDSCFLSMIRHIHANDRLPHYWNICVTNLRAGGAYVFENNVWNFSDYDNLLYMLMTARMSDLEELIRDRELVQEIRNISRVKDIVDNYWNDTDKFVKQNKQRIINMLYNYTKNNIYYMQAKRITGSQQPSP